MYKTPEMWQVVLSAFVEEKYLSEKHFSKTR
jgi:hypothetical protein